MLQDAVKNRLKTGPTLKQHNEDMPRIADQKQELVH